MIILSKPRLLKKSILFLNYFTNVFLINDVLLSKLSVNIFNKTIFLNTKVFFLVTLQTCKKSEIFETIGLEMNIFLKSQFKIFNVKSILFRIENLNKEIKKKFVEVIYVKFLKFKRLLFVGRMDFFINFLNITYLIIRKKISIKCYLVVLSKLFVILSKKSHAKFNALIKFLILWSTNLKNELSKITGIKFTLSGRLKGKQRAKKFRAVGGNVPCQTIISNLYYNRMHAYNLYGAFGFKLWINY